MSTIATSPAAAEATMSPTDGVARFEAFAHFVSLDPAKNRFRFYILTWQPGLWGDGAVIRCWGRLGTDGRSLVAFYPDRESAQESVESAVRRRLGHGYRVVEFK